MPFTVYLNSRNDEVSKEVTETNPFTGKSVTRIRRTLSFIQRESVSVLLRKAGWDTEHEKITFDDGGCIGASFPNLLGSGETTCEGGAVDVLVMSQEVADFIWNVAKQGCMFIAPAMPGNPYIVTEALRAATVVAGHEMSVCGSSRDLLKVLTHGFESHEEYVDQTIEPS